VPVATPITIAQTSNINHAPQRNAIQVGGFIFVFYRRTSDNYLVYISSPDGQNWSSEQLASHVAIASDTDFTVFTDGVNILIAYPTGSYSTSSATSCTAYTRKGTQSNGVITWNNAVSVLTYSGYSKYSIIKTKNYFYLAFVGYLYSKSAPNRKYHIYVYRSTDASSWTQILDSTTMTDAGYQAGVVITKLPKYDDGIMLITGKYSASAYSYKTYDGSTWGSDSTVGSKTANAYATGCFDAITTFTHLGETIVFAYLPSNSGGTLYYQYYTTSWSTTYILSSLTCLNPALFEHHGFVFVVYIVGSDIYITEKTYYSPSCSIGDIKIISSETSPANLTVERLPTARGNCLVWRSGSASPFNIRFALLITALENVLNNDLQRYNLGDVIQAEELFSNFTYGLKVIVASEFPQRLKKRNTSNDLQSVWS
jgi:hypothetical protein